VPTSYDAIILGAGAAGLMCAARAGQRGKRVLVLERADKPGKKILISGGGRCNFTNIGAGPTNYLSANPHFAKSALARYTARDFLDLVESYGIAWHEKTLVSSSAIARPNRSSRCCWRNARKAMWPCAAARK
jgi:predicted flavoprotein YhiN